MRRRNCRLRCSDSRHARCRRLHYGRGYPSLRRRYRCGSRLHSRCLGGGFLRLFLSLGSRFCLSLRFSYSLNLLSHPFGDVCGNRTRVSLLFGDTKAGQKVNDRLRLDLQFARQLVDSDLIRVAHAIRSLLGLSLL
jgi:hypothetical protein